MATKKRPPFRLYGIQYADYTGESSVNADVYLSRKNAKARIKQIAEEQYAERNSSGDKQYQETLHIEDSGEEYTIRSVSGRYVESWTLLYLKVFD